MFPWASHWRPSFFWAWGKLPWPCSIRTASSMRRFHSNWKRWRKKLRTTPELLVPVSKKKVRCSTIPKKRRPPVVKPAERERRRSAWDALSGAGPAPKLGQGRQDRVSLIRAGSPGPCLPNKGWLARVSAAASPPYGRFSLLGRAAHHRG